MEATTTVQATNVTLTSDSICHGMHFLSLRHSFEVLLSLRYAPGKKTSFLGIAYKVNIPGDVLANVLGQNYSLKYILIEILHQVIL